MILQAFTFYIYHSWKNAIVMRFRRLRQPKYLFGAIVGFLYFYFFVFMRGGARRHGSAPIWGASPDTIQLLHTGVTVVLFVLFLLAWLFPRERAALVFTEAEIAFLFPAPIGRRTLINFKLLRTQLVILISAIMFTIFGRAWGGSNPFIRVFGWWIVLATMGLHSLGSSFFVTRLTERGLTTWKRRITVLVIIGVGVTSIAYYTWLTAPGFPKMTDNVNIDELQQYFLKLFNAGALYWLLLPFRVLLAPFFATNWHDFAVAIVPAILLFAAHYWWVMSANVAFEEASIELSRKTAEKIANMRAGKWGAQKPKKAKRSPFQLGTEGSPFIAILWKNLISSGQIFSRRFWFIILWITFITVMMTRGHFAWGIAIATFSGMFAVMSLFFGPQIIRLDLRQDLPMIDVLKTFPMRGWQIVLGEVLAPALLLAAFQLVLIAIFLVGSPSQIGAQPLPFGMKLSACVAAAVVLPFLDLIAILLQNTSVLLLPAWFQFDKTTPRGIETMGQQLILIFGQVLTLSLCLAPAGLAFGAVLFVTQLALSIEIGIVLGAIAGAAVMCVEVAVAVRLLGKVFERFDLSAELGGQ
ncbi:MAG: putative ABC exporter domain-containing protein [Limisphaerales bacterium]